MYHYRRMTLPALAVLALLNAGCSDDDDDNNSPTPENGDSQPFSMRILHINDHHSHLESESATLTLAGADTDVEMGGFPRVTAKMRELEAAGDNLLKLHAGDAITGTLYYTLFEGQADAELMNDVCFDAFVVGNHEFDGGDAGLKTFLDFLNSGSCGTVTLGANVVPQVGTPLAPNSETDYIKPYMVKDLDGEKVGIIGIDIAAKTQNSSSPLETTQFLDETQTSQQYIDELKEQGINKIVLLTHNQYGRDIAMSGQLTDVDVIIDGDSHTLLGNTFADLGLSPEGPYPTLTTDKNGNTVCIAQAWQYANIVGELAIEFDPDGVISSCTGTPHLLLGDTFERDDAEGNSAVLAGEDQQAVLDDIASLDEVSVVTPDASAAAILARYADQVDTLQQEVIGTAPADLCFERIPGQGRSEIAGCTALTNAQGSDISNIVALAFKEQSIEADIAIQNGGGVRIDIPAGDITIGDAYTLLPFANTLYNLQMTGAQIRQVLEESLDFALSPNGSTGAYPYASGLRWDVDATQPMGSRIQNLAYKAKTASEWSALDEQAQYTVVTNSFVAAGRDGYLTFGTIAEDKRVDTYLDYAQAFVDYVKRVQVVEKLPLDEYSTQSFRNSDGELQE